MNINEWAAQYKATKKLPEKTILCTTSGCTVRTTAFGTNLDSKVQKAGGIENLLLNFKCRGCRTSSVEKPLRKVAKSNMKKTSKEKKKDVVAEMVRNVNVDVNAVPVKISFNDPEAVRQLTEGACQRPDIYLNNDRACDGCALYEHCACSLKQLLSETGRKVSNNKQQIKRKK